jgi:hypothetical protein
MGENVNQSSTSEAGHNQKDQELGEVPLLAHTNDSIDDRETRRHFRIRRLLELLDDGDSIGNELEC